MNGLNWARNKYFTLVTAAINGTITVATMQIFVTGYSLNPMGVSIDIFKHGNSLVYVSLCCSFDALTSVFAMTFKDG